MFTQQSSGNVVDSEKNGSVLSEHIPTSRQIEEWNNAKVLAHTSRENEPERSSSLKPDLNCLLSHKHIKQFSYFSKVREIRGRNFGYLLGLEAKFASFPGDSVVKNSSANAGDKRDMDLIPGSGKSHGRGNGNPLQKIK